MRIKTSRSLRPGFAFTTDAAFLRLLLINENQD